MKMFQCVQKPYLQQSAWLLCLGLLVACRGGGVPTVTLARTPEPSIAIGLEIIPTPSIATTAISLPTQTNTSTPISMLEPTDTPVLTPTLSESEIITLENAHKIAQIGKPFALKNLLAEIVFRAGTTWIVVTSENGQQIQVYDFETQKRIATLEDEVVLIESLVVSADGHLLAAISPSHKKVVLWNLDTFEKIGEFPLLGYESFPALLPSPTGGEFSNDNHFLVVWGCRIPTLNYQGLRVGCLSSGVIVYDLSENEVFQELNGYQEATTQATFSPDNSTLVLTGKGEAILKADLYVWDVFNEVKIHTYTSEYDYMTDGRYRPGGEVFVADAGGYLLIFDSNSWNLLSINRPISNGQLGDFVYGNAAAILIVDDLSDISFRDPDNTTVYHRFNLQIGFIYTIIISPDGRFIFTISEDGFVRKWGIPQE